MSLFPTFRFYYKLLLIYSRKSVEFIPWGSHPPHTPWRWLLVQAETANIKTLLVNVAFFSNFGPNLDHSHTKYRAISVLMYMVCLVFYWPFQFWRFFNILSGFFVDYCKKHCIDMKQIWRRIQKQTFNGTFLLGEPFP